MDSYQYRVLLSSDPQTGQVVAEIPALGIADHGKDLPQALTRLQQMLKFHLECLQVERKNTPVEQTEKKGRH